MKQTIFISIIVAIVFLAVGRLTAPKADVDLQPKIDSLERDIAKKEKLFDLAMDSVNHYKVMAETWYYEFEKAQKGKVIIRTIYRNDLKNIDRLNATGIDSAFTKRYGADSIK